MRGSLYRNREQGNEGRTPWLGGSSNLAGAKLRGIRMMGHARGTFTVRVLPMTAVAAEGIGHYSLEKEIHGDLEAASTGEMFGAGDPKQGEAGYVAFEVVVGTLHGKKGSFVLLHQSTMDKSSMKMNIIASPGSGTGDLEGIAGTFTIKIEDGQHFYDFEYALPE